MYGDSLVLPPSYGRWSGAGQEITHVEDVLQGVKLYTYADTRAVRHPAFCNHCC